MPFLPEDKTLGDARKEAASAGYKSMTEAAMHAEDRAKTAHSVSSKATAVADTAYKNVGDSDGPSTVAPGTKIDLFEKKWGDRAHWDAKDIDRPTAQKKYSPEYLQDLREMRNSLDYRDAVVAKERIAQDTAHYLKQRADTAVTAAQTPTPRRAQD